MTTLAAAVLNVPLVASLGCAALIALILLARMTILMRYNLVVRFFGFNLTLRPESSRGPSGPCVSERPDKT